MRLAFVTGANRGIGLELTRRSLERGDQVFAGCRSPENAAQLNHLQERYGDRLLVLPLDVTNGSAITSAVATVQGFSEHLDILFNNAGIQGPLLPLAEITEDDWNLVLSTNLSSVFLGSKHAIPVMLQQGGGVIISTSSTMGLGGKAGIAPYACTKAGIISLTKTMAAEYGSAGIRVNCICPGVIYTPMGGPSADLLDMNYIPLRRAGQPEEIAKAALFLASDDSSFVTGVPLVVDGGWVAEVMFPFKADLAQGG